MVLRREYQTIISLDAKFQVKSLVIIVTDCCFSMVITFSLLQVDGLPEPHECLLVHRKKQDCELVN